MFNHRKVRRNIFNNNPNNNKIKMFKLNLFLIFVLLSFFLVLPSINAVNITLENVNSLNPLSSQNLNILTCGDFDQNSASTNVICHKTNQKINLDSYMWNDTCVFSTYNPYNLQCFNLDIISDYELNNISKRESINIDLKKTVKDPQLILNLQNWDGGFGSPSDTAIAIWILSKFNDKYSDEIDSALTWLKTNRDNIYKCWPQGSCSTEETAKTMAYLSLAGYNDSKRIYYDGLVWLENKQNYIEDSDWYLELNSREENTCNITIDGSTTTYTGLNDSVDLQVDFTAEYGLPINISCNHSITTYIKDQTNLTVFYPKHSDQVYYKFPGGPCWSNDDWDGCDLTTTIYAVMSDIDSERLTDTKEFLTDSIVDDYYIGSYIPTSPLYVSNSFYYTYIDQVSEFSKYFIFEQNNDGSYGGDTLTNKDISYNTMAIVQALELTNNSYAQQTISDARTWLKNKLPLGGFEDLKVDSLIYLLFKNKQTDYLLSNQNILTFDKDTEKIILSNPSEINFTNLNITVEGNLDGVLTFSNLNNISEFEDIDLTITKNSINAGTYSGFIVVSGNSSNGLTNVSKSLIKIPVIINEKPYLNISASKEVRFLGSSSILPFTVYKSNGNFNCKLNFDNSEISGSDFNIGVGVKSVSAKINLVNDERATKEYSGNYVCNFKDNSFTGNFTTKFDIYPSKILSFDKDLIKISNRGNNPVLGITNLINDNLDLKLSFKGAGDAYLTLSNYSLSLKPNGYAEITITNIIQKGENVSFNDNLVVSVLNQDFMIPFEVDVVYVPLFKSLGFKIFKYLGFIIIVLGIMYVIYYFSYDIDNEYKKDKTKLSDSFGGIKEKMLSIIPDKIKHILKIQIEEEISDQEETESPVDYSGVASMIKIMLSLNKEEKDIKKRLKKEGLSEEEISGALAVVNEEMEDQEELEKEENIVKVIKKMDESGDTVRGSLKQSGFSDAQINQAFEEIEEELSDKEKELQEHLAQLKPQEDEEEVSLLDIEKNKNS